MKATNISANIIPETKTRQYIAHDKVKSFCVTLDCFPNDILIFFPNSKANDDTFSKQTEDPCIGGVIVYY